MTNKIGRYYQCEDCSLLYEDEKWAEKCEKWCLKDHTCNIDITKHRVKQLNLTGGINKK